MDQFSGKVAVVTGGGTGMGRELCQQLAGLGCHVAMCDVSEDNMLESQALCYEGAVSGVKVSTHVCDVSDEVQMQGFQREVEKLHGYVVHLLFNNAGIGGGGGFVLGDRQEWEKTFAVCWY
jgi:NAD(P)-dependent dehydrogenase (short-subunit alcohol dehydrogenase family)